MNLLQEYNKKQIAKVVKKQNVSVFRVGDTVKVHVRITEGTTERIQAFEGVCIARRSNGVSSTFTVRKISQSGCVERVFYTYSPKVEKIEVVRYGEVRRAKLYYLRDLEGKATRINEKSNQKIKKQKEETVELNKKNDMLNESNRSAESAAAKDDDVVVNSSESEAEVKAEVGATHEVKDTNVDEVNNANE